MRTSIAVHGWILPAVIGAGVATYLVGFFLPGQQKLARLRENLSSKEAFIAATGNLAPAVQAAQDELDDTLRYNRAWSEAAPSARKVPDLFGRISALAKGTGLKTTRFNPEPIETLQRIRRIPVLIGCEGTFPQVGQFLCDLEQLAQATWINSLQMEADAKDRETVKFELVLDIFADNPGISGQASRFE